MIFKTISRNTFLLRFSVQGVFQVFSVRERAKFYFRATKFFILLYWFHSTPKSSSVKVHSNLIILFLYRSLFSKKTKGDSQPGWKLFGQVPPKSTPAPQRDAQDIRADFQSRLQRSYSGSSTSSSRPLRRPATHSSQSKGHQATEIMSTTALILENRPT